MKKLEDLLLEAKESKIKTMLERDLLEKIKEANFNKKITDEGGLCRLITKNNRNVEKNFALIKKRVDDSDNDELKEEFQLFIKKINDYRDRERPICKYCGYKAKSRTDLSNHNKKNHPEFFESRQKRFYDVDYETKIQRLNEVIKQQEEELLTWADIKSILHIKWSDNIKKIEEICEKTSPEALKLFNTIKEKINFQVSNVEQWFYDVLVEKFNNTSIDNSSDNPDSPKKDKLSNYKKYISLSKLEDKEILNGNKSIGGKDQDIDILITFKDGPKKYNGVNINGIGISCEGERYHKYSGSNGKFDYNKTAANDFLRYGNKTYFIIPWDEKERTKGYNKNKIKERAAKFIDTFILNVLSSIFYGARPIYNPIQHQKQDQDKKLKEIADALHKIGKFEYNGEHGKLEINDLGTYFLFNKYNLAPKPGEKYIWSSVFKPEFIQDDEWKNRIYNAVINNEKTIKEKGLYKKTVDYINKFGRYPQRGSADDYNKRQAARKFAKLFEEIKKRTSK